MLWKEIDHVIYVAGCRFAVKAADGTQLLGNPASNSNENGKAFSKTWTVPAGAGAKYKYFCPPHEGVMNGDITVVAAAAATKPATVAVVSDADKAAAAKAVADAQASACFNVLSVLHSPAVWPTHYSMTQSYLCNKNTPNSSACIARACVCVCVHTVEVRHADTS